MSLARSALAATLLVAEGAHCTPAGRAPTAPSPPPVAPPAAPPPARAARRCPEAVRPNARGEPVGVTSAHVRWCFPGEARCFCDADQDCYAQEGHVPCSPLAAGDAPPPPAPTVREPVPDRGTLSGAAGLSRNQLTVLGAAREVWVYAPASRPASPPLVLAFHGTNSDGQGVIDESGARALADAEGLVVVAPTARWFGTEGSDYDHPEGNGTYWETRTADPATNPDLALVRAALAEALLRYRVDPHRVYAIGHSNGGFMSLLVAVALRDRIAAFAENSAGLVTCAARPECSFQGDATTCADLARLPGWCACDAAAHPVAIPAAGRRPPAYLSHGAQDPMVSVFYTCALAARLAAEGVPAQTFLWEGGHHLAPTFARRAWAFLSAHRLP